MRFARITLALLSTLTLVTSIPILSPGPNFDPSHPDGVRIHSEAAVKFAEESKMYEDAANDDRNAQAAELLRENANVRKGHQRTQEDHAYRAAHEQYGGGIPQYPDKPLDDPAAETYHSNLGATYLHNHSLCLQRHGKWQERLQTPGSGNKVNEMMQRAKWGALAQQTGQLANYHNNRAQQAHQLKYPGEWYFNYIHKDLMNFHSNR
jgi:hypothetical protein